MMFVFDHVPKCAGSSVSSQLAEQMPPDKTYTINGWHTEDSINQFSSLPECLRYRLHLVRGHLASRLRNMVPADATWITLLRDPVECTWSFFQYGNSQPHLKKHNQVPDTIEEFLGNRTTGALNVYTRYFGSVDKLLRDFAVVGRLEQPDDFEKQCDRVGLKVSMGRRWNQTAGKQPLDERVRQMISERLQPDRAFYEELIESMPK